MGMRINRSGDGRATILRYRVITGLMALDEDNLKRLRGRRDRILAHIRRYQSSVESAVMPMEVTQSGISRGTKISRSHVSELLDHLCREGIVCEQMRHVTGSGRRTRVYLLTPTGMKTAQELVETIVQRKTVHFVDSMPRARHFFGRENEAAQFRKWLASDAKLLAIKGIAGVGKTTFVARMVEIHGDAWNVFWYRFYEWSSFKNMFGQLSEFLARTGSTRSRSYLDSVERIDILEISSILEDELSGKNTLMVFDDYHKTEEKVVQFMNSMLEVVERTGGVKIVVIGRYIPSFYDTRDIVVRRLVEEMELSGLDKDSSRALLRATHRANIDFDKLYALTHGNPLAIELIHDVTDVAHDSDLTRYIQGEVYSKLSPGEKKLMCLVSVFRYPVPLRALNCAEAGIEAVDSLVSKGLLGSTGGIYDVHDMFRSFFYNRLSDSERKSLHRNAAEFYRTLGGYPAGIEMQYHLVKAGEISVAINDAVERGDDFIAKGYAEEFSTILSMLENELIGTRGTAKKVGKGADHQAEALILMLRGEAYDATGRPDDALDSYRRSLEIFTNRKPTRGVSEKIAAICRRMGIIYWGRRDIESALSWFERGMKALKGKRCVEASRLYGWIGWANYAKGDVRTSLRMHKKELELAKKLGEQKEMALANNDLGTYYHAMANWSDALRYYRASLGIRESLGDRTSAAALYSNMASIYETLADYPRAIEYYEKSRNLLHQAGDITNQSLIAASLGQIYQDLGDMNRAEENLGRSIELATRIGDKVLLGMAYSSMAEVWLFRGNSDKALELCNDAIRHASPCNAQNILGSVYCTMGQVSSSQEEWHSAGVYLNNSIEIFKKLNLQRQLGKSFHVLGRILLAEAKAKSDVSIRKKAIENLNMARAIFKAMDARNDLKKVRADLTSIHAL